MMNRVSLIATIGFTKKSKVDYIGGKIGSNPNQKTKTKFLERQTSVLNKQTNFLSIALT